MGLVSRCRNVNQRFESQKLTPFGFLASVFILSTPHTSTSMHCNMVVSFSPRIQTNVPLPKIGNLRRANLTGSKMRNGLPWGENRKGRINNASGRKTILKGRGRWRRFSGNEVRGEGA